MKRNPKMTYRNTDLYRLSVVLETAKSAAYDLHTSIAKLRAHNPMLADAYERECTAALAEKVKQAVSGAA